MGDNVPAKVLQNMKKNPFAAKAASMFGMRDAHNWAKLVANALNNWYIRKLYPAREAEPKYPTGKYHSSQYTIDVMNVKGNSTMNADTTKAIQLYVKLSRSRCMKISRSVTNRG